jgi:hypothetical protein
MNTVIPAWLSSSVQQRLAAATTRPERLALAREVGVSLHTLDTWRRRLIGPLAIGRPRASRRRWGAGVVWAALWVARHVSVDAARRLLDAAGIDDGDKLGDEGDAADVMALRRLLDS